MPASLPDRPRVLVGCAKLPPRMSRAHYFGGLSLLETDVVFRGQPRPASLRRWRREAPDHARFAVVAAAAVTHDGCFRPGPVRDRGWDATRRAAEALAADAIVFRSGPGVSPSAANRDAMRAFFAAAAADVDAALVWIPGGLWTPVDARAFAAEAGVIAAEDPLAREPGEPPAPPPSPGPRYLRVEGLGRRTVRDDDLEVIADALADAPSAWVVFAHPDRWRTARALRARLDDADD